MSVELKKLRVFSMTCCIILSSLSTASAQITKPESKKLWAAVTASYNAATAEADFKKAENLSSLMEKKYPNDPSVLVSRGVYYYSFLDEENKALTAFSKALKVKPGYAQAYLYRAKLLAKKGVYEKAIADLNVVLQQDSKNTDALTDRGGYFFAIKKYDSALVDFQSVINLAPEKPSGYNDAANTLQILNRKGEASALFTTALARPSSDSAALLSFYGKHLMGENNFADAVKQYQKAIVLSGNKLYAEDYNNAGVSSYKIKADIWAHMYFDEAIKISPDNLNYYDNKASVYLDSKDWNGLIKMAFAMLQLNPNNAKANMLMYVGLVKSGRSFGTGGVFNIRGQDLEKNKTTKVGMMDSILFFLPEDKKARAAHMTQPAYKKTLGDYFTDFSRAEEWKWESYSEIKFGPNEPLLKYAQSPEPEIKREIKNNTLFISIPIAGITKSYYDIGPKMLDNDIRFEATFKINQSDSASASGLYVTTNGGNPITWYFLISPVSKTYYIGFVQGKSSGVFHSMKDPGSNVIPGEDETIHLKVVTRNSELALLANNKLIISYPLSRFTDLNNVFGYGYHTENKNTVELTYLACATSTYSMNLDALAGLGWRNAQPAQPYTAPQKPRRFLGTMLIWADKRSPPFANVFGIYGPEDNFDQGAVFSMLTKKCNPTQTYSKYTFKRGVDPGSAMKGIDLRDYHQKGNYHTDGSAVY